MPDDRDFRAEMLRLAIQAGADSLACVEVARQFEAYVGGSAAAAMKPAGPPAHGEIGLAVWDLHKQGLGAKAISQRLHASIGTVNGALRIYRRRNGIGPTKPANPKAIAAMAAGRAAKRASLNGHAAA